MNYTRLFNDNITIFNGAKKKLDFKGDFYCKVESLKFDLTGEIQSTIIIYNDKNIKININDLIKFEMENKLIIGKIREIKKNENNELINEIIFVSNSDLIDYEFIANGNKITFNNLVFNDFNGINFHININEVAITTQQTISLSTALRQIRRKKKLLESIDIINNEVIVTYNYGDNNFYGLSENDVELTNKIIDFSSDSYNLLYLYNQDNLSQYNIFYLKPNGEVVNFGNVQNSYELPEPIDVPYISKTEIVEQENYNNLTFAKSKIKDQEYNNQIEFSIPRINNFNFIELGSKIEFWTKNGNSIKSVVSFLEIKEDVINVKLGISRTKFSDQKRRDKV